MRKTWQSSLSFSRDPAQNWQGPQSLIVPVNHPHGFILSTFHWPWILLSLDEALQKREETSGQSALWKQQLGFTSESAGFLQPSGSTCSPWKFLVDAHLFSFLSVRIGWDVSENFPTWGLASLRSKYFHTFTHVAFKHVTWTQSQHTVFRINIHVDTC